MDVGGGRDEEEVVDQVPYFAGKGEEGCGHWWWFGAVKRRREDVK